MSDLVVMALPSESGGRIESAGKPVLYTGVGTLNAALRLTEYLLQHEEVSRVINLGTAGSAIYPSLSMVRITHFYQGDMDATTFGYVPYQTPGEDFDHLVADSQVALSPLPFPLHEEHIHTFDRFVTDIPSDVRVVDMEAYALAKVTGYFQKPFVCVKFITDGADESAAADWNAHLEAGAVRLTTFLKALQ